jgi:hypothetical protein
VFARLDDAVNQHGQAGAGGVGDIEQQGCDLACRALPNLSAFRLPACGLRRRRDARRRRGARRWPGRCRTRRRRPGRAAGRRTDPSCCPRHPPSSPPAPVVATGQQEGCGTCQPPSTRDGTLNSELMLSAA